MIKKLINKIYYLLIAVILYFPLIRTLKDINFKILFTNKEMIISIITNILICGLLSFIIGIISFYISRYYFLKKRNIQKPMVLPMIIGVLIYLVKTSIAMNGYILLILGYILLLTPFISYLEFKYLKSTIINNKDSLSDFGKIELFKVMDKSIITFYFITFIIIYGDNILSSLLFDNRVNLLTSFIRDNLSNKALIANAIMLSFLVILFLILIVYMIAYEKRLRGKYEKDY